MLLLLWIQLQRPRVNEKRMIDALKYRRRYHCDNRVWWWVVVKMKECGMLPLSLVAAVGRIVQLASTSSCLSCRHASACFLLEFLRAEQGQEQGTQRTAWQIQITSSTKQSSDPTHTARPTSSTPPSTAVHFAHRRHHRRHHHHHHHHHPSRPMTSMTMSKLLHHHRIVSVAKRRQYAKSYNNTNPTMNVYVWVDIKRKYSDWHSVPIPNIWRRHHRIRPYVFGMSSHIDSRQHCPRGIMSNLNVYVLHGQEG